MRTSQRGSAILITLLIIIAMLGGAAVLVSLQTSSTKSTSLVKGGLSALYCAEAGLSTARATVLANYVQWGPALTSPTEPTWLAGIDHDLDDDGANDYFITLKDNDDEVAPAANDPANDSDLRVFIISTCTKYPDTPKQVTELMTFSGGGTCYQSQLGGCGANGNSN